MRIRKRFPSFPIVPSSVASSTEAPSKQEEMEVSSFPVPAERTAREASRDHVLTDWKDTMARAHKLIGGSSHGADYHTVQPCVQEELSHTGPVVNEEDVTELQSGNKRNKSLLEQANPTETMVIKQGGGFSNSQKKRNYSGTGISNRKGTTISSSSQKGTRKYGKAETVVRIGCRKERAKARPLTEIGCSRHACANGSSGKKHKNEDKDEDKDNDKGEEGYSSGSSTESKVKMRSLKFIYADIRSLRGFSKVNLFQNKTDGKSLDEE